MSRSAEPSPRPQPTDAVKETVESVVVAFILAFIFRLFIVEAFIIPTGSMAPTLLGRHRVARCIQCGYEHPLDAGNYHSDLDGTAVALCPMCRFPIEMPEALFDRSGDRILVQKYLYAFNEPNRFDVMVFKNPQDPFGDSGTFIKRLVGLPRESLMILDGNVYVRPFEFSGWHIASKVDPEQNPRWERIQRAVWQPVYHSEYVPLDHGQSPARGERYRWQTPWLPDSDAWSVDGRRDYLFTPVSADQVGTLRFDFRGPGSSIRDYASEAMRYPYNQFGQWTGHHDEPLEDVRIAVTVTPASRQSQVILQAVARWDAGPVPIRARFDAQPNADLWIEQQIDSQWQVIGAGRINGLFSPGRPVTLEFWIVDQTLIAWVDGREIRRVGTHVDFKELLQRPGPVQPYENDIAITVAGGAMTLSDVQLDRDLYYGSERDYSNGGVRGGVPRSIRGSTMLAGFEPVTLADDEFFFLGDNSPHSQDGRQWTSVDPWVRHRYFFDKRDPEGKVPRQLLLGRAFLVYYPAPLPLNPDSWAVVPNLGDIRRID